MADFCDMTPVEPENSMAADLRHFLTWNCSSQNSAETKERLTAYLSDFSRHIETTALPHSDAEKEARLSPRFEFRALTAWGWLTLLRMHAEEIDAREPFTINVEAQT
jgi:hypothetical protein